MKYIISVLFFLSFQFIGFSQINTYNLSSYAQPDYYRKVSSITPRMSFNSTIHEGSGFNNTSNLSNGTDLNYEVNVQKYNRQVQSEFSYVDNTTYDYQKNTSDKSHFLFQGQSLNWNSNFFLSSIDVFFGMEIDHYGALSYRVEERKNGGEFKTDNKYFDVDTNNRILAKIGIGRVENLSVAWHAIRILESICEHSSLEQSSITHEQIVAFADILGDIQNIRRTDFRLEFNKEVEMLFKYLKSANLIKEDYYLFAKVLDAYRYELFTNRKKGSNFSIGYGVKYDYFAQHQNDIETEINIPDDYENINIYSRIGSFLSLGINYYKPLNHSWQLEFENSFNLGKDKVKDYSDNTNTTSGPNDRREEELSGSLDNTLGLNYFLSRRTNLLFEYSSRLTYNKDLLLDVIDMDDVAMIHSNRFSMDLEYYFSPWHTLSLDLGLNHLKGYKSIDQKTISTFLIINTNYYFH